MVKALSKRAAADGRFVLAPGLPHFIHINSGASVTTSISGVANGPRTKAMDVVLFSPIARGIISARGRGFSIRTNGAVNIGFVFAIDSGCRMLNYQVVTSDNAFDSKRRRLIPMLDGGRRLMRALPVPVHKRRALAFSLSDLFGQRDGATASHGLAVRFAKGPT